ncbi:cyclase [Paramuricea clavata]|uniref:Cyclase n=1 Tax=Paramuricea clavata TaxID=317549 RepID=A0A6S7KU39_PARCT|nr:cyclase [Paramuricea clavata]
MVDSGKIKGVGMDVRSIDQGQSKDYFAHRILSSNKLFSLENVANIEKLPSKGAIVYVSPMKIKGGSGGPARIFAQTDPVARSLAHQTVSIELLISIVFAVFLI